MSNLDLPFTTQWDIQAEGPYSGSTDIIDGFEALRQSREILDSIQAERNKGVNCDKQELIDLTKQYDSMIQFMAEAGYMTYREDIDSLREEALLVRFPWLYNEVEEANFLTGSLTGSYATIMERDNPIVTQNFIDNWG